MKAFTVFELMISVVIIMVVAICAATIYAGQLEGKQEQNALYLYTLDGCKVYRIEYNAKYYLITTCNKAEKE